MIYNQWLHKAIKVWQVINEWNIFCYFPDLCGAFMFCELLQFCNSSCSPLCRWHIHILTWSCTCSVALLFPPVVFVLVHTKPGSVAVGVLQILQCLGSGGLNFFTSLPLDGLAFLGPAASCGGCLSGVLSARLSGALVTDGHWVVMLVPIRHAPLSSATRRTAKRGLVRELCAQLKVGRLW